MSHPRCVYINNRCGYQSITQQYLKRCLIKDDSNYMFRPIAAIIRFSSESMVVVLYRIGMGMSRWWDLIICDVHYMLLLRGMCGGGGICDVRYPGVCSSSMSARCCPMWDLNITDAEISPSWHNHTNPIKHYHHTFGWNPDDVRNRPKHVVTIILY